MGGKRYLALLVISTLMLTLIPISPAAATEVSGEITKDTTWTVAGSPYIVTDDVFVENGATLTIEPGVEVKFNRGAGEKLFSLRIGSVGGGTLIADGTWDDPIIFTSNRPYPVPGDWDCIFFGDSSVDAKCIVDNCIIEYASHGIHCDRSSPTISNNLLMKTKYYGVCCDGASPKITDNVIFDNRGGIDCSYSSPTITGNMITTNRGFGISCMEAEPLIEGNIISDNDSSGIDLSFNSDATIINNEIVGNGYGIGCSYSSPGIVNNTIADNSNSGIWCTYYAFPYIVNNIITGNDWGGIYCYATSFPSTIGFNDVWGNGYDYDGCSPGYGDISADPQFVDAGFGDYHLRFGSPCIDAGTNARAPGVDLEGNPRPYDGDGDGVATVDMGAYEYSGFIPPAEPTFPDVPSDFWSYFEIEFMVYQGIISGYADGLFRPADPVFRSQFTKMLVNSLGFPTDTSGGPHFTDVPPDHWAYDFIETAYNNGIVQGYGDGRFGPEDLATRAHLATMLVRGLEIAPNMQYQGYFPDVPEDHWAWQYIETAYEEGIVRGYGDGSFGPEQIVRRDQTAVMIYRAIFGP
ncbi:MAG: S-layer homology domain-containing protein [Actinomycetota bacterium]|nr:S-layer homology domain-containing protein [Actinomycetota bacterium]